MAYVDGFVLPVPRRNLDAYRAMAETAGTVWREHGALDYREWVADDVPEGELTSFGRSVLLEDDEVVVFAYVVYPSREARDAILAAVMKDPRLVRPDAEQVFDTRRMFWGGFAPLVTR